MLCRRRRFSPRSLEVTEACHCDVFFTDLRWSPCEAAERGHAGRCLAARRAPLPNLPDGRTEELEHVSDLSEGRRSQESHCSGTSCQVEDRMSSRGRYTWSQQSFLNPPAPRMHLAFIQQHQGKQSLINVSACGRWLEVMKEAGWNGCYLLSAIRPGSAPLFNWHQKSNNPIAAFKCLRRRMTTPVNISAVIGPRSQVVKCVRKSASSFLLKCTCCCLLFSLFLKMMQSC